MGFRGEVAEQHHTRRLRAQAWTLAELAARLGVSKSSISLWVRDVEFTPSHVAARIAPVAVQLRELEQQRRVLFPQRLPRRFGPVLVAVLG